MRNDKHTGGCEGSCCLSVSGLSASAGGRKVFYDVGFHAHCGEIIALIGPNGAGKSTLIKALLGQSDYKGEISFSPAGGKSERPLIGYVPQSPSFDSTEPVSVLDLFICCTARRPVFLPVSKKQRDKVIGCLSRVGGGPLIDKRVGSLSGGELQRVLLALALEPLPHILILDEPMSGVDAAGTGLLISLLDGLRTEFDLSIIISSHNFDLLYNFADRVLLLNDTITASGTPGEVLGSDEFKAAFGLGGGA